MPTVLVQGSSGIGELAQADAARVYRDLSPYRIQLVLEDDGWHVDYDLNKPGWAGGGPHYVIEPNTGAIVQAYAAAVVPTSWFTG